MTGDANTGVGFGGFTQRMLEYLIAYNLTGDEYIATALRKSHARPAGRVSRPRHRPRIRVKIKPWPARCRASCPTSSTSCC